MSDSSTTAGGRRGGSALVVAFAAVAVVAAASLVGRITEAEGQPSDRPARLSWEVPVTPTNLILRLANNSPQLAADPTNPDFVVLANRLDSPDFGCTLQVSGSGGRGWLTAEPVPKLPEGADKCYGPEVAFDAGGLLYYLFVGLEEPGNEPMGAFLTTSRDRGRTFSPPRRVLGPGNFQVRMAFDPTVGQRGRLHLVWQNATTDPPLGGFGPPPNPIMAAYSDDGGASFSTPVQVSDPDRDLVVAPALALGPDGHVHVLYYDLGTDTRDYFGLEGPTWEGRWSLVLSTSTDGGRRFRRGVVVDDDLVPPERVMLIFTMPPATVAATPEGTVLAAWHDARNGDWDVFLRRSTDRGRTWSEPVRVNDDVLRNGRHQYLPRLSVAPRGRVDLVWYDRRGNAENRGNDAYFATSDDDGARFSENLRLSSWDFDSRIGVVYDIPSSLHRFEFGSRIALLSGDDNALAAWTDTRNTGRAPPSQDIFAREVLFGEGGSALAWGRGATPTVPVATALVLALTLPAVLAGRRRRPAVEWGERRGRVARRGRARRRRPAVLLATALVSGACGSPGAPLPPDPPVVRLTMVDHRFRFGDIPAGRVVFEVANHGSELHEAALVPLEENLPPIEVELRDERRTFVERLAGAPYTRPGQTAAFAVDLPSGRYAFLCLVVGEDNVSHALKGMASEFRVR